MTNTYHINNLAEFHLLIKTAVTEIKEHSSTPYVFLLQGDLGVGKTEAAKQIAQVFHVKQNVKSPTFTYSYEYQGLINGLEVSIIHWDLWRLDRQNFELSGFVASLDSHQVIIVEWWERFKEEIELITSHKHLQPTIISIVAGMSEHERVVEVSSN